MGTQFIRSDELNKELLRIIEEDTDELFIISPYIDVSVRFSNALIQVSKRKTKVTIISRWEKKFSKSDKENFDAFISKGFDLYLVDRLHAKLYFTKAKGILSSINFLKGSQQHSEEVGIVTDEPAMKSEFRRYAEDLIQKSVVRWGVDSNEAEDILLVPNPSKSKKHTGGYCIRSGEKIPFNVKSPFTKKAFTSWNRFKNPEFKEKYCHFSGEESNGQTTFSRPILKKNWTKAKKAHNF